MILATPTKPNNRRKNEKLQAVPGERGRYWRIVMRVLLRDMVSREYFVSPGMWDIEGNHAFDCRTTRGAISLAQEAGRGALEIVVTFEPATPDVVVPVRKAADPGGWRREPHLTSDT
jgi:hypothetical protein